MKAYQKFLRLMHLLKLHEELGGNILHIHNLAHATPLQYLHPAVVHVSWKTCWSTVSQSEMVDVCVKLKKMFWILAELAESVLQLNQFSVAGNSVIKAFICQPRAGFLTFLPFKWIRCVLAKYHLCMLLPHSFSLLWIWSQQKLCNF